MGADSEKTIWQLWAEKVGLVQAPDLSGNPHVRRGVEFEPTARQRYEEDCHTMLLPVCGESDENSIIRASFDGIDDIGCPVEIKCPSKPGFWDAKNQREASEVFKRYYPQVQHQIYVANAQQGILALWCDDELLKLTVLRDDAFIADLISKALSFWDSISKLVEPEKDPARDTFIPTGQELEEWTRIAEKYRSLEIRRVVRDSEITQIETQQKALQKDLISIMGNYAHGSAVGVRVTRYLQRGNVDYGKLLKHEAPQIGADVQEKYRKPSSDRVRVDCNSTKRVPIADSKEADDFFVASDADNEMRSLYF
jgi:putative phage-type endonuclease